LSGTTVTFGELMLRLVPPGFERVLQTPFFHASFGGSEANVAVSLSVFGVPAAFVSILPSNNSVADAALAELRKVGVETRRVLRAPGRMGIYFVEAGANQRPSTVLYDRDCTAIALAAPSSIDWHSALEDANWLHVSGITPGLSASAARLTLEAVRAARSRNVTVSCDLNYRKNLWKWGKAAGETMPEIVEYADVLIANEEDIQLSLGIRNDVDVHAGNLEASRYQELSARVLSKYPRLQAVAVTLRESHNASQNGWSACLNNRSEFHTSCKYEITHIVDRVGAGDSFAAGLIYGMQTLKDQKQSLEFAVAASCLKHSIPGDFNRISLAEVRSLLENGGSGRVQR
jgi:2-dehydro-3-deoxygluconokinase